jgi:hypothetical protein
VCTYQFYNDRLLSIALCSHLLGHSLEILLLSSRHMNYLHGARSCACLTLPCHHISDSVLSDSLQPLVTRNIDVRCRWDRNARKCSGDYFQSFISSSCSFYNGDATPLRKTRNIS